MVKRIFILSALIVGVFASVGECWQGGVIRLLIEDVTKRYVTDFSRQYYSETVTGDRVYAKGRLIFDGDGYWHNFYAVAHAEKYELYRLEIDGVLIYTK